MSTHTNNMQTMTSQMPATEAQYLASLLNSAAIAEYRRLVAKGDRAGALALRRELCGVPVTH